MKLLTFKISKRKWLRNSVDHSDGDGLLLRDDGKQCCMGQVAQQCGVPRQNLLDRDILQEIDDKFQDKLKKFNKDGHDLKWVSQAYNINDNYKLTDAQKMSLLTSLMKKHGIRFVFTK